jgi:hypothetical protein
MVRYRLFGTTVSGKTVNITGCEKLTKARAEQLKAVLEKKGIYKSIQIKEA